MEHLVTADDGARAVIHSHGAHVTSWCIAAGAEQLYLSERSEFRAGSAIRGGVPIIFPQFNRLGTLPRHGFARTLDWEFVSSVKQGSTAQAVLRLTDSSTTRAIWDFPFVLEYRVRVGGQELALELDVMNPGTVPFSFTGALHTYLRVDDISNAAIDGLGGVQYRDKTRDGETFTQTSPALTIDSETDRIYDNAPDRVTLRDKVRSVQIDKLGFTDIVVWNPFDKGNALQDLTPGGERYFICVEAAAVTRPITVGPNAHWVGTQILRVENING